MIRRATALRCTILAATLTVMGAANASAVVSAFPACDQYTLQGDAFSTAIVDEAKLEFPIEDAIANMRVIDALFRSAKSGSWEKP